MAAALLALSCSREEPMVEEAMPEPAAPTVQLSDTELRVLHQMRGENNRISFDEAMQLALGASSSPSGGSGLTKSTAARRVGSVKVLRTAASGGSGLAKSVGSTPIEMSDTLAYVFNFEHEGGFAIVAADVRVETPLLAFCEQGSLGDTIDNPGLALFLEGVSYYIERSIAEGQQLRDSLLADILAKIWEQGVVDTVYHSDHTDANNAATKITKEDIRQPYCDLPGPHISYSYGEWEAVEHVAPMLTTRWHQGPPFNNDVPIGGCTTYPDNDKAPAGCVAISTAQLMAYWRHPASLDGMTFDWNMLRAGWGSGFNTQAAHLVRRIGAHVGMSYTCDRSGSSTPKGVEFLHTQGYYGGSTENYSYSNMASSLNQGRPVLMRGNSSKINETFLGIVYNTYYEGGHSWVADGLLKRRRLVTETITVFESSSLPPSTTLAKFAPKFTDRPLIPFCWRATTTNTYYETSPTYLHHNWGWWGGTDNGYYVAGSFNSVPGADLPSNTLTKSDEAYNYKYEIKMFPFIYK